MNKAFEKILDQLDEASVLRANSKEYFNNPQNGEYVDDVVLMKDAIKIVNEVAEEYKDGWIPCSERLPEEYTVLCCDNYGEMIVGHPYFDEVSNTNYSVESDNEMMYDCVAWQPLPEPFKERDSD